MKIHKIVNQHRRDFTAIYVCEHCNFKRKGTGYDDAYFHNNVIPYMPCENCGNPSPLGYKPRATRYTDKDVV